MKLAAATLFSLIAFAATADEVVVTVASDAAPCLSSGAIVARGSDSSVRATLQRGTTEYHFDLAPEAAWQIAAEVPGCWAPVLVWTRHDDAALQLRLERAGTVTGNFASDDRPSEVRGDLFPVAGRADVLLDGVTTSCALSWPSWECAVPASRMLDLRVHVPGYAPLFFWDVRVSPGERLRLPPQRLERGASLAGWVEDPNGDPARDARLSLLPIEAAPEGTAARQRFSARTLPTKANARGFFQFAGVAPGTYRVVSEAKGVSPVRTTEIRVRADEAITWPVPIAHVVNPSLVMFVQPATGARGERWTASFRERDPFFPDRAEAVRRQASETGRIAANDLHAGAYEVELRDAAGSVVEIAQVDLSDGGERTLSIDIRGVAATGTLHCGDDPLEAELTFTNDSGRALRTKTDAEGRFSLSFPTPGAWKPELRYPLEARASMIYLDPVEIPSDAATATLDLRVPGGRIKGRVINERGVAEQAAVHVVAPGRVAAQMVTGTDGTFDLIGIRPGTYSIDAGGRSGTTAHDVPVTIDQDETQVVELKLAAYGWVKGIVRLPSGAPASGASVQISAKRGRWTRTVTDVRGAFEYPLPGGTEEVYLIVIAYSYPAVALRTAPTASRPIEITLPSVGGLLRVEGGDNPAVEMGIRIPLRFLFFGEPSREGVLIPAGTYVVCPNFDPRAQCKSATIAPASETRVTFTKEKDAQ